MAEGFEDRPMVMLLAANSDVIRSFSKQMFPSINCHAGKTGFVVHRGISMRDICTQMHDLTPTSPGGESNMDLDSSLDLTDASFHSIHHPVSVDSGPQGIHGNMVTSSSSASMPTSSHVPDTAVSADIVYNVVEVPFDCGITDAILFHCLGPNVVMLLFLEASLVNIPDQEIASNGLESDGLKPYREFLQTVSAVSSLHDTCFKVMLAGYKEHTVSFGYRKSVFHIIRQCFESPHGLGVYLHDEDLAINEPETINKLHDALRTASSEMDAERNLLIRPSPQMFHLQDNGPSISSDGVSSQREITRLDKEQALTVLALVVQDTIKKQTNDNVITTGDVRTAVQTSPDLYNNVESHLSNLVSMGCLIPCYKKGKVQQGKYIIHQIKHESTNLLMKCSTDTSIRVTHSPVLRIRVETGNGNHVQAFTPLLIAWVVSECMNSWDISRQGSTELVFKNAVAFSAKFNACRLVMSIEKDCIYLSLFDYRECEEGTPAMIDKTICQTFLTHVQQAIVKLHSHEAVLEYSIRCQKTEGELNGESGWMEVDDMKQCGISYRCTSHDNKQPHFVKLADTLQVWFVDQQGDTDQAISQGVPDSSMDTTQDIRCEILPEIAECFGHNWDLFFIQQGLSNEVIQQIKDDNTTTAQKVHDALGKLKRVEKHVGKLSFASFRNLVMKYKSLSFNFEKFDEIVQTRKT